MKGIARRDAAGLAAFAAALAALHGRVLFGGRVYFSGELTYISQPWLAVTAEQISRGQVPLWNPYALFGMPWLAGMQTALFYPPNLLFHIFPFGKAAAWHFFSSSFLGAFWTHLWLRSKGLRVFPSLAGAAAFALGGCVAGQLEFPHQVAALIHLPALLLFRGRPLLLALALASAFLAGYPPKWAGMVVFLFVLACLRPRRDLRPLLAAGLLAALICGAVLLPGAEFLAHSARGKEGLPMKERTYYSLAPLELTSFIHPELTRRLSCFLEKPTPFKEEVTWTAADGARKRFTFYREHADPVRDPAGAKYHSWNGFYVGAAAFLALLIGFGVLAARSPLQAAALGAAGAFNILLVLGESTRASSWLWENFPPLRYVRGPDRFLWLHLAVTPFLVALGLQSLGRRAWLGRLLALCAAGELLWTAWGYYPTMPSDFFSDKGSFVRFLQAEPSPSRYMQFQAVPIWAYTDKDDPSEDYREFKEMVFRTFREMNYALGGNAFHLSCASPQKWLPLIPAGSVKVIKLLARSEFGDMDALIPSMKWSGIRYIMDRIRGPKKVRLLARGTHLWNVWESPEPVSAAYWLPAEARGALQAPFAEVSAVPEMRPWGHVIEREDRIRIRGRAPRRGLVYAADARYPGWELYVNGKRSRHEAARDAFMFFEAPEGDVEALLLYRPWSWTIGAWLSVLALAGLAWDARRRLAG